MKMTVTSLTHTHTHTSPLLVQTAHAALHPPLPPVQLLVSGDDGFVEFDHERGALVPVGRDFGREAAVSQNGFHYAGGEGGAVQCAVLFRHGDERVHQRLLLDDVVRLVVIVGLLQLVRFLTEQRLPHVHLQTQTVTI